ncbi:MAG: putative ABC transporter permease [Lachnospiraceae bacterium]|jgi:uncharacterized membrane protein|nr:putative ABC transporter permease [Lachnospiraceae bacterium]MCI9599012.1 putative ABC transporter permease [Lachnospiraceae bacterium]
MYSYHFREWLSFFYFYCIFGWCFESAYVSLKNRHLTNRGFLKGPWLPLYGSGAILVLWLTLPFQETPALVYVVGAIGATVLEYVTGETMVRLFKVRYWDYSDQKLQYKGHICLSSTAAWGFLSLLMVYVVHRPVEQFIFWMHEEAVSVLTFGITVCMVYDFSNAFREAMDLRAMLMQAEQLCAELEQRAAEKKRVLEAAAVFAIAAVEERMEEHRERAEQSKEQLLQKMETEIRQLQERQEQLKERMVQKAKMLPVRNPGFRLMADLPDAAELRERMHRHRKGQKTE